MILLALCSVVVGAVVFGAWAYFELRGERKK